MKNIVTTLLLLLTVTLTFAQQAVRKEIELSQRNGASFSKSSPLQFVTSDIHRGDQIFEGLKQGIILNLDKGSIAKLLESQEDLLRLTIPTSSRTHINLLLKKNEIFTPDFKLFTSSDPHTAINYIPGIHYKGIVEGDASSLVALSVFDDQVMALVVTDEGNFNLGHIRDDKEGRHILYNDRDLEERFEFECGTSDDDIQYTDEQLKPNAGNRDVDDCVRLHIEINHDIVNAKGGAVPAANYMTGIFNQTSVLLANEYITLVISEILAWTTTSPYTGVNSNTMLTSFKDNTGFFNGDLSHLVSYDSTYGGVAAGFAGICNSNPDNSKCYSGTKNSYSAAPIYSWPVYLLTHEMGHLLGSRHTHACVWNGNNTPIDGCNVPEGGCSQPPPPPAGGTIMSYCTPSRGYYIDFNEGFGPQPGNVIRNTVNATANCLTACGPPSGYCASEGANSSTEFIEKVVLGDINNLSGNNGGYEDYTSLSTTLNAGNTYTITLKPKFTGGNKYKSWRVWIDYNNDFDWYDTNEMVAQGSGTNTITLTFTVPANSISYTTRMRIAMQHPVYTTFCGTFPIGEVEDYNVIISGIAVPTCSDGIQNQGEAGVDCGGPCSPCPASCTDWILNQDETNVDCGGICPPCPTCDDGIQNQGETDVDCGGPCIACPPPDTTVLLGSYFETGMDSWIDGGPDVSRVSSANSYEGSYSIRIADNSGTQSAMTSPAVNLSDAIGVQIQFHFYAVSMEFGEDFYVMYNNDSGTWSTIAVLKSGTQFTNNSFYVLSVVVPNFTPTSSGSFRIQCDASDNNDQIFIDAVTITKLTGLELIQDNVLINKISDHPSNPTSQIEVYPNPARDLLYIKTEQKIDHINIVNVNGKDAGIKVLGEATPSVDISSLNAGIYIVFIRSGKQLTTSRFVKL